MPASHTFSARARALSQCATAKPAGSTPAAAAVLLREPLWHHEQYVLRRLGAESIAKLIGCSRSTVRYWLARHGIATRRTRVSRHPSASRGWIAYYYGHRQEYLAWCGDQGVVPDPLGGKKLSLAACAALAGTCRQTIKNWVVQCPGVQLRDRREAARASPSMEYYP